MQNRSTFNRHALPEEIKEIVMPRPRLTERKEEKSILKGSPSQKKGAVSRTEQASPLQSKTMTDGPTSDYGLTSMVA